MPLVQSTHGWDKTNLFLLSLLLLAPNEYFFSGNKGLHGFVFSTVSSGQSYCFLG
jgi:hypothetical protein